LLIRASLTTFLAPPRQNVPEKDEALALLVELDARQARADAEVEASTPS
jgi:hypothetical protein